MRAADVTEVLDPQTGKNKPSRAEPFSSGCVRLTAGAEDWGNFQSESAEGELERCLHFN